MMDNNLPLFYLEINPDDESGTNAIALTGLPANETEWVYMSQNGNQVKQVKFSVNDEKRIITGVVSKPGQKIYRVNNNQEEYQITQTEQTIEQDMLKFAKRNAFKNVNLEHETPIQDVFIYESWLSGEQDKIHSLLKDDTIPVGSWCISMKVQSDSVWQMIKEGKLNGFSLEGEFIHKPAKEVKQSAVNENEVMFEKIRKCLNEINKQYDNL